MTINYISTENSVQAAADYLLNKQCRGIYWPGESINNLRDKFIEIINFPTAYIVSEKLVNNILHKRIHNCGHF